MRLLHAIHDFFPRHQAGSEIYALELCRTLSERHHVTVLCAEYDPSREHGQVNWRVHQDLTVIEVVNNWICRTFEDTYRPPLIGERITQILRAVQPDVVHVHSVLNLSYDLPAIAHAQGAAVVSTLHDYSLVCASGGQRVHRADAHVCHTIDTARCARCVPASPQHQQIRFGRVVSFVATSSARQAMVDLARRFPRATRAAGRVVRRASPFPLDATDVDRRIAAARRLFDHVDLVVAPSESIAAGFSTFGILPARLRVSDYGCTPLRRTQRRSASTPLRIGYVGSLVWHKGVHVLIDAVRELPGDSYQLKVFGDPAVDVEYSAALRSRAADLPVSFMGAFGRDRTEGVYGSIDVLVVPSLWLENSPLVIHEAFMAGVPVVASRIGGIIRLVEDGRDGLLYDPESPAALHTILRDLIEKPWRLAELSRIDRPVKTIADDAREWETAYAEVIAARQAPRET
jgi:glycosyltransferase involved in cell wall biosynthesis